MINVGDIIFQLLAFVFLVLMIIVIVTVVRSFKNRNKQLDRIEEKLDNTLKSQR
ncbi:DUF4083 family protein [Fictibacillus fluitans]|uniref:DUF4083 family protein n=1 Tax=Fictibacillus fluitans TaxID=3058422 RepID=A0ABT8HYX5_9BACL|nr:DUF4083 family protein [Fictibacillus sp. NE201]MDN4525953.1 DUF4083 family protein [Fictibacillus sp. NE201]